MFKNDDLPIHFFLLVSHVGARVQITLGEPVHDDIALLKWAHSTYPKWTEQQRHSAVQALNGNFGDYGKVSDMQANKKLPFSGTTALPVLLLLSCCTL
jgi:hypothetical protein